MTTQSVKWMTFEKGVSDLYALYGEKSPTPLNDNALSHIKKMASLNQFIPDWDGGEIYRAIESKVKLSQVILSEDTKSEITWIVTEHENKARLSNHWFSVDNKFLFYWPSWCWKTLLAHALANKLQKRLFIINLSTVVDSSLGKTSSNIFQVFQIASANKGIIFLDEFDMLWKSRSDGNDHWEMKRIATSILQNLDSLDEETIFIAATNHIELIDTAILRRFNKKIGFSLPSKEKIQEYLSLMTNESGFKKTAQSTIKQIALSYENWSFAECRDDFMTKVKRYVLSSSETKTTLWKEFLDIHYKAQLVSRS